MPSCGKSTLGQALSGHLNLPFIDLDAEIVRKARKSIPQIFEEEGETTFRSLEATCLRNISESNTAQVVATGGGAPLFHNNMKYMNARGITIFLSVSVKELGKRLLSSNVSERPLVNALDQGDFLKALSIKYNKRLPTYRQALVQVTGDNITLNRLIEALQEANYLKT